jgi:hypothetical protein
MKHLGYKIGVGVAALIVGVSIFAARFAPFDTWRGTAPFCDGQCLPG